MPRMPFPTRPPVIPLPQPLRSPPADNAALDISTNPSHKVTIRHPGYKDTLLRLPAFDRADGGLFYDTALVACGIIAGNRWDGFFTKDAEGKDRVVEDTISAILPVGTYYFQLPDYTTDNRYPVVPTFRQWAFPHETFPSSWTSRASAMPPPPPTTSRSDTSAALAIRDGGRCRMSFHTEAYEKAHLCPVQENDWFHAQMMQDYNTDEGRTGNMAIYDVNNIMLLRADLHKSFDDRKFAFVPKDGTLVVHMLWASSELSMLYQNVRLHPMDSIPREFLLARFAWALFPMLEGFLLANKKRFLLSTIRPGELWEASAEECKYMTSKKGAPSRTNSPTKRLRNDGQDGPEDGVGLQSDERLMVEGLRRSKRGKSSDCVQVDDKSSDGMAIGRSRASPTPPLIPPTTTASLGSKTFGVPLPAVSEKFRLSALRQQGLKQERARSDPEGRWEGELAWANGYLMERSAEEGLMRKMYDILGTPGYDQEG